MNCNLPPQFVAEYTEGPKRVTSFMGRDLALMTHDELRAIVGYMSAMQAQDERRHVEERVRLLSLSVASRKSFFSRFFG
jgi:hypothetical protein